MGDELNKAAVERVIRRALHIEGTAPDADGFFSPEAILAAAREAGISEPAIRSALALEQLGPDLPVLPADAFVGAAWVSSQAQVSMAPADVISLVALWLEKAHRLQCQQLSATGGMWRPRGDLAAQLGRSVSRLSGGASLSKAAGVHLSVASLGRSSSMLRLTIDRNRERTGMLATGSVVGVGGVAMSGVAAVATAPAAMLAVVPAVVVAAAFAMGSKSMAARWQRDLDQLVDRIARGERPSPVLQRLMSGVAEQTSRDT